MAILMAVAIPLYSAQLEKARVATDKSNLSTAQSLAMTTYLLQNCNQEAEFTFGKDEGGQLCIKAIKYGNTNVAKTETDSVRKALYDSIYVGPDPTKPKTPDDFQPQSKTVIGTNTSGGPILKVTIKANGSISTDDDWTKALQGK